RTALSTRFENGHETKRLFGSSMMTSIDGSCMRTYFAAVAPPQPPPMTTTRRPLRLGARSFGELVAVGASPLLAQPAQPATAPVSAHPANPARGRGVPAPRGNSRRVTGARPPPRGLPRSREGEGRVQGLNPARRIFSGPRPPPRPPPPPLRPG